MSAAKMGARVQYCGHEGWFVADIFQIHCVNVVRANGPVTPDNIVRTEMETITHTLSDMPEAGFWRPDIGVFVVPVAQVKHIRGLGATAAKKPDEVGFTDPIISVDIQAGKIAGFNGPEIVHEFTPFTDKATALKGMHEWFKTRSIHVPRVVYPHIKKIKMSS